MRSVLSSAAHRAHRALYRAPHWRVGWRFLADEDDAIVNRGELPDTEWDTVGRAAHQGPEVDGTTSLVRRARAGDLVRARVIESQGVDLVAAPLSTPPSSSSPPLRSSNEQLVGDPGEVL